MHILHLSATGALGGAERCMLDIVASIHEANPDWRMSIVTGADGAVIGAAKALGAGARVLPYGDALARLGEASSGGRLAAAALAMEYVSSLSNLIDDLRPDVIHTHGLKMHILAAWAAGAGRLTRGSPRIIWHVHDYVGARPATARFLRWSLGHC